jgi:hypothetical protein
MVRQGVRPDGDGDDRHDGGRSGSSESFTETIRWAVGDDVGWQSIAPIA